MNDLIDGVKITGDIFIDGEDIYHSKKNIDELRKKYGERNTIEELPDGNITRPSVVFKPRDGKKQLVPWNGQKVLELWQQRGPFASADLPPTFNDKEAVVNPPAGVRGRDRLVLKAKTVEELMTATRDDE